MKDEQARTARKLFEAREGVAMSCVRCQCVERGEGEECYGGNNGARKAEGTTGRRTCRPVCYVGRLTVYR